MSKFKEGDLIISVDHPGQLAVYERDTRGIETVDTSAYCRVRRVETKKRGTLQMRNWVEQKFRLATETEKILYG